jgi:hypothetical protein
MVLDPERFIDAKHEPMERIGRGVVYMRRPTAVDDFRAGVESPLGTRR